MAYKALTFAPGVNAQYTPTYLGAGCTSANFIRFRDGLPEVKGGWQAISFGPTGVSNINGICRCIHQWSDLQGNGLIALGTNTNLYVINLDVLNRYTLYDVTPISHTQTPAANPFSTTSGSNSVLFTSDTTNYVKNTALYISGGSNFNGVTINGTFYIFSAAASQLHFLTAANANATGSGGGSPTIKYGFSAGTVNATTFGAPPMIWSLDNWGQQLVGAATYGFEGDGQTKIWPGVVAWTNDTTVPAATITNSPPACDEILVAMPQQILIAFGCSVWNGAAWGSYDPMNIAWTTIGDYTVWAPAATNAAGSFRIGAGSRIMAARRSQQQILVWTDTSLVSMNYLGQPYVFGFNEVAHNCGLVARKAAAVIGNKAFWMSYDNFWMYDGQARPIECVVWDFIFKNINRGQIAKCFAAVNSQFNEIAWYFPSANSTEIDSYVEFNYVTGTWNTGTLGSTYARTAWSDTNWSGYPLAIDYTSTATAPNISSATLYLHESTYAANGAALPWYYQSGYADLAEGEQIMFADQFLWDAVQTGGSCTMTIKAVKTPNDSNPITKTFTVGTSSGLGSFRLRGRQLAVRFDNSNNAVGNFWRLGKVRVRLAGDGRQ